MARVFSDRYNLIVQSRSDWTLEDVHQALQRGNPVIADIRWSSRAAPWATLSSFTAWIRMPGLSPIMTPSPAQTELPPGSISPRAGPALWMWLIRFSRTASVCGAWNLPSAGFVSLLHLQDLHTVKDLSCGFVMKLYQSVPERQPHEPGVCFREHCFPSSGCGTVRLLPRSCRGLTPRKQELFLCS